MSSQQDKTRIAGTHQDLVDPQPASSPPEIAAPESPKIGSDPDRTENHTDTSESITEVLPVPPETSSLMKPDYDEFVSYVGSFQIWVEGTPFSKGLCPYCNRAVWALANDGANTKNYTIKPTSIQWPQPERVDENDLAPRIRELSKFLDTEEIRLKALRPTRSEHDATYLDICIREDPWLISVRGTMKIGMEQRDTHSDTWVTRELTLQYFDMRKRSDKPGGVLTINTDAKSKYEYEKAKKEFTEFAKKYICLGQRIGLADIGMGRQCIRRDERGLTSIIESNLEISVSEGWPNTRPEDVFEWEDPPYARFKWMVQLGERSVAYPDGFDLQQAIPEDQLKYWRSKVSERATENTRQSYEWLKATMEWFFKKHGERFQGRPLDRAITNLLEPCKPGGKCGHCKEEHRTGDCLLPWD